MVWISGLLTCPQGRVWSTWKLPPAHLSSSRAFLVKLHSIFYDRRYKQFPKFGEEIHVQLSPHYNSEWEERKKNPAMIIIELKRKISRLQAALATGVRQTMIFHLALGRLRTGSGLNPWFGMILWFGIRSPVVLDLNNLLGTHFSTITSRNSGLIKVTSGTRWILPGRIQRWKRKGRSPEAVLIQIVVFFWKREERRKLLVVSHFSLPLQQSR